MPGDEVPTQFGDPPFTIRTIPSSDRGFAEHVRVVVRRLDRPSPATLQERLRTLFPFATVRPRELAGEHQTIWYVYREGRWTPPDAADAGDDPRAGRLVVGLDGVIIAADPESAALLAGDPSQIVGRNIVEFAAPGAEDAATLLFRVLVEVGETSGTLQAFTLDGSLRSYWHRARTVGDRIEIVVRRSEPAGP